MTTTKTETNARAGMRRFSEVQADLEAKGRERAARYGIFGIGDPKPGHRTMLAYPVAGLLGGGEVPAGTPVRVVEKIDSGAWLVVIETGDRVGEKIHVDKRALVKTYAERDGGGEPGRYLDFDNVTRIRILEIAPAGLEWGELSAAIDEAQNRSRAGETWASIEDDLIDRWKARGLYTEKSAKKENLQMQKFSEMWGQVEDRALRGTERYTEALTKYRTADPIGSAVVDALKSFEGEFATQAELIGSVVSDTGINPQVVREVVRRLLAQGVLWSSPDSPGLIEVRPGLLSRVVRGIFV